MARDTMLYEICPSCGGTGVLKGPITVVKEGGASVMYQSYPCPACESRRVVAIGIMGGQLERMVKAELAAKGGGS